MLKNFEGYNQTILVALKNFEGYNQTILVALKISEVNAE